MSSQRIVREYNVVRQTPIQDRTFTITKTKHEPIVYLSGKKEINRAPKVEQKVISSRTIGDEYYGHGRSGRYGGPRARAVVINRTQAPPMETVRENRFQVNPLPHVYKPSGTSEIESYTSSSSSSHPPSFMNMQRTMENQLEGRRTDWEREVEKMQHNFFDMKTSDSSKGAFKESELKPRTGAEILTVGDSKSLFTTLADGSKIYRQRFDLYGFDTDDLGITAEDGKLVITASKEEDMGGASSMKQFSRTVDIPKTVDTDQLSSFLDDDGILTIEAPVDMSKVKEAEDSSIIRRTITSNVSDEPMSRFGVPGFDPPEYNRVVESSSTTRSMGNDISSPSSSQKSSSFTRTRYLGPDVEETEGGRKLKTSLYIGKKYKPDDITVKLYDYKINVDAKVEETIGGRTSRRQFGRDVDIPGPVERDTFRAVIGEDGKLYLGGSFTGNEDHDAVAASVDADMPIAGKSVNIRF